jgi:hypothetical protein
MYVCPWNVSYLSDDLVDKLPRCIRSVKTKVALQDVLRMIENLFLRMGRYDMEEILKGIDILRSPASAF